MISMRFQRRLDIIKEDRCGTIIPVRLRLGPPRWAAELGFSVIDLILTRLTQGPAVMIGRPPAPAAPKSGHRSNRPCHPKVAGQTHCLRNLERASTTVDVPKTLLKCRTSRDQGSLDACDWLRYRSLFDAFRKH